MHLGSRGDSWSSVRTSVRVEGGMEGRVESLESRQMKAFAGRDDALGCNHVKSAVSRTRTHTPPHAQRTIMGISCSPSPCPLLVAWWSRVHGSWSVNVSVAESKPYIVPADSCDSPPQLRCLLFFLRPRVLRAVRLDLYSPPDSWSLNRGRLAVLESLKSIQKPRPLQPSKPSHRQPIVGTLSLAPSMTR